METVDYTAELFAKVMENMADYYQMGETVCGAEDPAVITLTKPVEGFETFTVVRVTNRAVSAWKSDTFLQFSNDGLTDDEYRQFDELMDELAEG